MHQQHQPAAPVASVGGENFIEKPDNAPSGKYSPTGRFSSSDESCTSIAGGASGDRTGPGLAWPPVVSGARLPSRRSIGLPAARSANRSNGLYRVSVKRFQSHMPIKRG